MINRGGEKVPVVEVEQLLYAHPAVREVAIVAMPDERLGERACAFVVLEPGAEFDFAAMQHHLDAGRLSKPYWPSAWRWSSELPRTPSGKIQKFVLRDRISGPQGEKGGIPMTTAPLVDAEPSPVDEVEFAALKAEIRDYVETRASAGPS